MRGRLTQTKIQLFMKAVGKASQSDGRVYLTGGATAVLLGWRETTMDVDIKLSPEPLGIFGALPEIKDQIDINVELASPDDFLPPLPGWQNRSRYIATKGRVDFYHYDFYAQVLAKIERDHAQDREDVAHFFREGLIDPDRLLDLLQAILPGIIRFPAVDPSAFQKRVGRTIREYRSNPS